MSTDDEDCLYFDNNMALNMMRPCALTSHQGSVTIPFNAPNFYPTI